jgi:hypothetical protein
MRNCQRFEIVHVTKNNIRTRSFDLNIWNSEISEILKLREPNTRDFVETVDAGEGFERWNEFLREMDRWNRTVDEVERVKSREWFESSERERNIGGTVREG